MKDGGPAFPSSMHETEHGDKVYPVDSYEGMSLRDYFAAAAMTALLRSEVGKEGWATVHGVASDAYKVADAMLKAREK